LKWGPAIKAGPQKAKKKMRHLRKGGEYGRKNKTRNLSGSGATQNNF